MKKAVIILSVLALIAGSCGLSTKKQAKAKENNPAYQTESSEQSTEQTDEIELDTLVIPQLPENSDIKTDVQILLPASYRGTELSDFKSMLSEEWYDFYQNSITKNYFLKKANIEIGRSYDECSGDSTTSISSKRNSLIFIKGIILQNEEITSVPIKQRHVWVGEKYEFILNGKTYVFRGDGVTVKAGLAQGNEKISERWDEVKNYKLYLSGQGKEEQLIVAIPTFNDTFVQILWIGDLDGDGFPDFILDTSRDYEEKTVLLFLSSKAGKGEIVRVAASSGYQFDC